VKKSSRTSEKNPRTLQRRHGGPKGKRKGGASRRTSGRVPTAVTRPLLGDGKKKAEGAVPRHGGKKGRTADKVPVRAHQRGHLPADCAQPAEERKKGGKKGTKGFVLEWRRSDGRVGRACAESLLHQRRERVAESSRRGEGVGEPVLGAGPSNAPLTRHLAPSAGGKKEPPSHWSRKKKAQFFGGDGLSSARVAEATDEKKKKGRKRTAAARRKRTRLRSNQKTGRNPHSPPRQSLVAFGREERNRPVTKGNRRTQRQRFDDLVQDGASQKKKERNGHQKLRDRAASASPQPRNKTV